VKDHTPETRVETYSAPAIERREDVTGLLHFQKGSYKWHWHKTGNPWGKLPWG